MCVCVCVCVCMNVNDECMYGMYVIYASKYFSFFNKEYEKLARGKITSKNRKRNKTNKTNKTKQTKLNKQTKVTTLSCTMFILREVLLRSCLHKMFLN